MFAAYWIIKQIKGVLEMSSIEKVREIMGFGERIEGFGEDFHMCDVSENMWIRIHHKNSQKYFIK